MGGTPVFFYFPDKTKPMTQPPNDQSNNSLPPLQPGSGYVSAGSGNGKVPSAMLVRFLDGERALPGYIVHHLGVQEIEKMRPELAGVTYGDFVSGFHHEVTVSSVNALQKEFVRGHFKSLSGQS